MIVSVFVRRLKPAHTFDDFSGEPRPIALGSDAGLLAALAG